MDQGDEVMKKLIKRVMIFGAVLSVVMLSAVSLQAVMFPIAVPKAVGDAVAADVLSGRTFSSEAGIGIVGTLEVTGGSCTEAPVRRTGQQSCWNGSSWVNPCVNPVPVGQDGALTPGVAWPEPRFTDNNDGTVTDNLTGLIWLKDANCNSFGKVNWSTAMDFVANVSNGDCGLVDGSANGDWRVPTVDELISLLDREYYIPSLSDTQGTGQWTDGDVFNNVSSNGYWSSTGYAALSTTLPTYKWVVELGYGTVGAESANNVNYVWPVRDAN